MPESFLSLPERERREALGVAAFASGRGADLLEKDVWVVWTLGALFGAPFGAHLSFKGGTSLSKAYHAIRRFSEDLDLTYDIRALLGTPEDASGESLPASRSQAQRWTDSVRERLPRWVQEVVRPQLEASLARDGLDAEVRAEGDDLFVRYLPASPAVTPNVRPEVRIEFGARSTWGTAREVLIS